MGKKNKLEKFEDILNYPNVAESYDRQSDELTLSPDRTEKLKGKWSEAFFQNDNPITLELACGKGDYALALARMYPHRNFLGVDIKGNRIWKGATIALEEKLENVGFLRTRIENIGLHFASDEIDEIWITFPDPFPRKSRAKKRLTSPRFLEIYRQFLHPDGMIKFKTDAQALFDWSVEVLEESDTFEVISIQRDIYGSSLDNPELEIKTFYEKQHLANGRIISYLEAKRVKQ